MVSTLEEVTLHQQNIEKIEALGQICPHLKILYLQNNLIGRLGNLHKLKVRLMNQKWRRGAEGTVLVENSAFQTLLDVWSAGPALQGLSMVGLRK